MKKVFTVVVAILMCATAFAQDKLYLVFEMMEVDNDQEAAYQDTEDFWEKIHQQRANSGDIIGWDLWRLLPGGEDQGYQYATVTLFSDKAAMFKGGNLMEHAKAAYPNMSEDKLLKKLNSAGDTRDLAVRIYMEQIATTNGDFKMAEGTVASFDWMKVEPGGSSEYEKAEKELFQPDHQKQVDAGTKGSWSLLKFIVPVGSDTYASHMTVNMFKDFDHVFSSDSNNDGSNYSEEMEKALATRDMKMVNMAELEKMVRKN